MFRLRKRSLESPFIRRFLDWPFNTTGATGRTGPSGNVAGFYNQTINPLYADSRYFSASAGIQTWRVPASGVYTIVAAGAAGGAATSTNNVQPVYRGGSGAVVEGDFFLKKNEILNIIVGQKGVGHPDPVTGADTERAGGGGASYVWRAANNQPIIVAGGGGGASGDGSASSFNGQPGVDASTSTSGTPSFQNNGTGGTNGNGGISQGGTFRAGAGAGFLTNGTGGGDGKDGISPLNGGLGGDCAPASGRPMNGGFGGGGADARLNSASSDAEGSGGGAGYSGGAGGNGSGDEGGGGGGSFIAAAALRGATSNGSFSRTGSEPHAAYTGTVQNIGAYNVEDGYVVITDMPLIYSDNFTSDTSVNYIQNSFNGGTFAWVWNTNANELNSGTSNREMAIRLNAATMGGIKKEIRVESHYLGTGDNDGSGLWIRTAAGDNYLGIITDDFPSNARGITLFPSLTSNTRIPIAAGVDFPVTDPHFFSLVYKNGILRFEVDGLLCAQANIGNVEIESAGMLSLAQNPTARYSNFIVRGK